MNAGILHYVSCSAIRCMARLVCHVGYGVRLRGPEGRMDVVGERFGSSLYAMSGVWYMKIYV